MLRRYLHPAVTSFAPPVGPIAFDGAGELKPQGTKEVARDHVQPECVPLVVPSQRSIGELFGNLASETSTLVQQEVELATTELLEKAKYAGKQAGYVAIGGHIGVVALQALLAAAMFGPKPKK